MKEAEKINEVIPKVKKLKPKVYAASNARLREFTWKSFLIHYGINYDKGFILDQDSVKNIKPLFNYLCSIRAFLNVKLFQKNITNRLSKKDFF